jgi:LysR family glycine cleavage system transcriptional activator
MVKEGSTVLKLPNLTNVNSFISASKTGNFAKTAKALSITPAAVSQQIKQLEAHLCVQLFERSKLGVELTQAGRQYLYFAKQAVEFLQQGQTSLEHLEHKHIFTVHALPSVASLWLMPKVLLAMEDSFGLEVRVEASHSAVDFTQSSCDAAVSFGKQDERLNHDFLFQDEVGLVVSPKLIGNTPIADLEQLLELPMIHVDWGENNAFLPSWNDWLAAAGYDKPPTKGPQFNLTSMAIDAAIQGKGLLLGQGLLIREAIKSGHLVPISQIKLPLKKAYYLVYPDRTKQKAGAMKLIELLMSDNL